LFAHAIAESDPFAQAWPYLAAMKRADAPTAEDNGAKWAASVGAKTAAQLRAIPADRTIAAPIEANAQGVKPLIDGRILPERGPEAFAAGRAHHVPYIIGGNSYEGSLAAMYRVDPAPLIAGLGANKEAVFRIYGPTVTGDPALLAGTLTGDISFLTPRRAAARLAAASGAPTWVYHFAYVPDAMRGKAPGAGHGTEIPFMMDTAKAGFPGEPPWSDADRKMAHAMHAYWVNFARTGNPNGGGLPNWPQFGPGSETLLAFEKDGVRPKSNFNAQLFDLLQPIALGGRPSGATQKAR
jgi:para-nitrobenzyl esterase